MEEQLLKTFNVIRKINSHFKQKLSDFDEEDILETFQKSKIRMDLLLKDLEKIDLEDIVKMNTLLVYLKLEYDNFLWCFDEMVDAVGKTLTHIPD